MARRILKKLHSVLESKPKDNHNIEKRMALIEQQPTILNENPNPKHHHPFKAIDTKPAPVSKPQIKITDLKSECLRHIFTFLDFSDLLNVADANVRFKEVACLRFQAKYHTQTFAINSDRINIHSETMPYISTVDSPLETVGKFLKYFGASITRLAIFGNAHEFYLQWVECCVAKYCTSNLVEIFFYNHMNGNMLSEVTKPFPLVESVTIIQSHLSANISRLATWFPRLSNLKLIDNVASNPECIEQCLPNLKALVIWLHGNRKHGFTKSNLKEAIRLNPNIRDLWLQFYAFPINIDEFQVDLELCQSVAVNLTHLERFVWAPENDISSNYERIIFKKLKYFVTEAPVLHFQFKQLEEMELRRIRIPINQMIDFICRNKKLTKLMISLDFLNQRPSTSSDQISKIVKNLPKLSELIIDWRIFSLEDIAKLLWTCKSLVRLQLLNVCERMTQVGHQVIQKNLDATWKVIRTDSDLIFKRKM